MRPSPAGVVVPNASAGDRLSLQALDDPDLSFGEQRRRSRLLLEQDRDVRAPRPVVDEVGCHPRRSQAELGVAQAPTSRAEKRGLAGKGLDPLDESRLDERPHPPVAAGARHLEPTSEVTDLSGAESAKPADDLYVAMLRAWTPKGRLGRSRWVRSTYLCCAVSHLIR